MRLSREDLEARVQSLEEQARFTLDILEMAATLGDFQTSINKLHEPGEILQETLIRLESLINFRACTFMLVNEKTNDFERQLCAPEDFKDYLDGEVAQLIDSGIFSLAIRENRPITVYSRDKRYRMVLMVLATSSRTRGMFVGLMSRRDKNVSSILLSLMSIILKNCANAIESFELYRLLRADKSPELIKGDAEPAPSDE